MNALGDVIAVCNAHADESRYDGTVCIYQLSLDHTTWWLVTTITSSAYGYDGTGYSVCLNEIGDMIAVGAIYSGHVRVYAKNVELDAGWSTHQGTSFT